jgi:Leucine-rich repeat (LRR) protein
LFKILKQSVFIFRPNSTFCTHKHPNTEAQNLKIRPSFLNYKTTVQAADIRMLQIDFATSTQGIGETFSDLKILSITYQSIKFVERSNFVGLTQLEELWLNQNQIEFLPEDVFLDLPNLEVLWLSNNKIKKLPENIFKNMKKLKEIELSNNEIDHLPEDLFMKNLEIEVILAVINPLKTIDVDFTKLKNLRRLNLKNTNCINFKAENETQVQEAQRLINQSCTKTTQK